MSNCDIPQESHPHLVSARRPLWYWPFVVGVGKENLTTPEVVPESFLAQISRTAQVFPLLTS